MIMRKIIKHGYLTYKNSRIMVTLLCIWYLAIQFVSCAFWY